MVFKKGCEFEGKQEGYKEQFGGKKGKGEMMSLYELKSKRKKKRS